MDVSTSTFSLSGNNRKPFQAMKTNPLSGRGRYMGLIDDLKPFEIPVRHRLFSNKKNVRKSCKNIHKPLISKVPKPIALETELKTVCDIDNNFFKIVEGRPVRNFTDVKVYIRNIRDITLFKANTAYLNDEIIATDTSFANELIKYDQVRNMYKKIKHSCMQFAKENYETAVGYQKLAQLETDELNQLLDQLNTSSFMYVDIRNKVENSISILDVLTKYGSFLYSLSPTWWTEKNVYNFEEKQTFLLKWFTEIDSSFTSPSKYYLSLDDITNMTSSIINNTPKLYFKEPVQLMTIFNDVGKQCLNYLDIQCHNASIQRSITKYINVLKSKVHSEIEEMQYMAKQFERQIELMEEEGQIYKNRFKHTLENTFQSLYASNQSIKLFTCVQYVHAKIFPNIGDIQDSTRNLAYDIEKYYFQLSLELDAFSQDVVKRAANYVFEEDIKKIKKAEKAKRALRECDLLRKSLYTSFEPPRYNKTKSIK